MVLQGRLLRHLPASPVSPAVFRDLRQIRGKYSGSDEVFQIKATTFYTDIETGVTNQNKGTVKPTWLITAPWISTQYALDLKTTSVSVSIMYWNKLVSTTLFSSSLPAPLLTCSACLSRALLAAHCLRLICIPPKADCVLHSIFN